MGTPENQCIENIAPQIIENGNAGNENYSI